MTTRCPKCGMKQTDSVAVCDCGYDLETYRKRRKKLGRFRRVRSKVFPFLSIVSQLLGVILILQVVSSIISIAINVVKGEILEAVVTLIALAVTVVIVMAIAEGIDLMFRVAEQQQRIAEVLHRIEDKLQ